MKQGFGSVDMLQTLQGGGTPQQIPLILNSLDCGYCDEHAWSQTRAAQIAPCFTDTTHRHTKGAHKAAFPPDVLKAYKHVHLTTSLSPPSHFHTITPSHSHTFTDHPYILPVVTVVSPPPTISTFTEELVRTSAVDIVQPDVLLRRPSSKLPNGCLYSLHTTDTAVKALVHLTYNS